MIGCLAPAAGYQDWLLLARIVEQAQYKRDVL